MTKLEELITNNRILFALKRCGYNYIEELLDLSENEILMIPKIGKKSAEELIGLLTDYSSYCVPKTKVIAVDFTEAERIFLVNAVLEKSVTNLRANRIKLDCLNKLKLNKTKKPD